ncbi:tmRNA-binding protein SmpB [Candidatus Nasuia deltocephalinicola]|nr:tmRNA-binding protein SmpB [Candidatus Nasuia deltocephalinicola]
MNIINKKYFKYYIINNYIAGIILEGWEVKYIKIKNDFQIKNSFIICKNKEFFLKNSFINIYNKNIKSISNRDRKLLLKKKEINEIILKLNKNNFKLLPISIFIKNNFIKLKISIVLNKLNKNEKYKRK